MEKIPPGDPSAYLESLMKAGQQSMKQFDDGLAAALGVRGKGPSPIGQSFSPFTFAMDMQREYLTQFWRFWNKSLVRTLSFGMNVTTQPARGDKRFKDDAWQETPYYDFLKQSYLLASKQLSEFVDHAQVDDKTRLQLRFHARQFIDAMSPSNFPATNPEVIRTAIQTRSASLSAGIKNLIEDIQKGRITRVDESAFEVGGNLAITPGFVVFENELIQLSQYTPQTPDVEKTPLLIVPPCINKYYLLDLGAGNSFVEYAVAQGHHVFLISWRSAVPEIGHLGWDDYLRLGPLKAIDVVRDIVNVDEVHALGFCVGGTILSCAAGVLAGRGERKLATITLLTTMLDFKDTGDIGLLIDEGSVVLREATIGRGGILPGKELAFTFGTLRANDLIWRYVVDSYLKGATPDAFDLLYWDSDSVSLPGPMYCWYTRNTYLENNIKEPGKTTQCGVPVDLSRVKAPLYILASREDHIVPWQSAYLSKDLIGKDPRFVLAASGHVAGVINPPARNKRSHWLNDDLTCEAKDWLEAAEEKSGSWWLDWDFWIKRHSSGRTPAPVQAGSAGYHIIEPAPGRYVKQKSN
ncbi:class I poly(R)-hydroxyalkanoic acid synthase [Bradyrhizobium sp. JYMT SZCCT0180]|uniref:PHA/PHB synthase family protein n=1 Tax=Bradyrhizobium sp. JYMT SZCCT0180 TaxID=2807666 RepID=UPI001BA75541|nr:class I poly(R)-hydroxyalkanoic acid synthase [Bradyrhizobium sp. JYMT SZCCT0180]MBR1216155.1 class I poly(R)-hydroxyalkanoic acid synthase [Bradyrhizobium sp. JYMT SZCCT0180]